MAFWHFMKVSECIKNCESILNLKSSNLGKITQLQILWLYLQICTAESQSRTGHPWLTVIGSEDWFIGGEMCLHIWQQVRVLVALPRTLCLGNLKTSQSNVSLHYNQANLKWIFLPEEYSYHTYSTQRKYLWTVPWGTISFNGKNNGRK